MNEKDVANLAWSYAVQLALTTGPSDWLRAALRSLLAELGRHDAAVWSTMTDEGASQLTQAQATLTAHPDRPASESVPAQGNEQDTHSAMEKRSFLFVLCCFFHALFRPLLD